MRAFLRLFFRPDPAPHQTDLCDNFFYSWSGDFIAYFTY